MKYHLRRSEILGRFIRLGLIHLLLRRGCVLFHGWFRTLINRLRRLVGHLRRDAQFPSGLRFRGRRFLTFLICTLASSQSVQYSGAADDIGRLFPGTVKAAAPVSPAAQVSVAAAVV